MLAQAEAPGRPLEPRPNLTSTKRTVKSPCHLCRLKRSPDAALGHHGPTNWPCPSIYASAICGQSRCWRCSAMRSRAKVTVFAILHRARPCWFQIAHLGILNLGRGAAFSVVGTVHSGAGRGIGQLTDTALPEPSRETRRRWFGPFMW